MTIKELTEEGRHSLYALIKDVQEKEAKNGNPFLSFTFSDATGEIKANMWKTTKETLGINSGTIVFVDLESAPYREQMGHTVKNIRPVDSTDDIDMSDYVAISPIKPVELYAMCMQEIECIEDREIKTVVKQIYMDNKEAITNSSAAKNIHHNTLGGLLWHSYRMTLDAKKLCSVYTSVNKDLVIAGTLLHDVGKIREMDTDIFGTAEYTGDGVLFGHLFMGAEMVTEYCKRLGISEAKMKALVHIIISHHGKGEWGAIVVPSTPEAYMVHVIDLLDSHYFSYEKISSDLEPGTFSDRQFALDGAHVFKF